MKSKGLGDSIEKFMKTTGIKTVAQAGSKMLGVKDCGCKKRKEALNKAFPYNIICSLQSLRRAIASTV